MQREQGFVCRHHPLHYQAQAVFKHVWLTPCGDAEPHSNMSSMHSLTEGTAPQRVPHPKEAELRIQEAACSAAGSLGRLRGLHAAVLHGQVHDRPLPEALRCHALTIVPHLRHSAGQTLHQGPDGFSHIGNRVIAKKPQAQRLTLTSPSARSGCKTSVTRMLRSLVVWPRVARSELSTSSAKAKAIG